MFVTEFKRIVKRENFLLRADVSFDATEKALKLFIECMNFVNEEKGSRHYHSQPIKYFADRSVSNGHFVIKVCNQEGQSIILPTRTPWTDMAEKEFRQLQKDINEDLKAAFVEANRRENAAKEQNNTNVPPPIDPKIATTKSGSIQTQRDPSSPGIS